MLQTKSDNPNYLAKVVRIGQPRVHPNADRLQLVNVDFQPIITGLDAKEGDLYIYFPLECQINKDFLSYSNAFAKSELNKDKDIKGFFNEKGRVKATRLRGILSEGYIHPMEKVNDWLNSQGIKYQFTQDDVDTQFDTIGEVTFVQKYIVPTKSNGSAKQQKAAKRESKLVEGQFRLHVDTEQLKRNMFKISPNDIISIKYKLHGTSAVFSRVLCKKKLSLVGRILKKLGVQVIDTHYDEVFSSRKVIKNAYADKKHGSFYDFDVWEETNKKLKGKILDGISIYGEIVGQMPNGSWIQKDYDYGCGENKNEFYVYRITFTNPQGHVFEFDSQQIKRYCEKYDLKTCPQFYYGYAKDKYELSIDDHWHENMLNKLMEEYNEKECYMCSKKVPEEGVVIRKENADFFEAYKLKSIKFLERESKELDSEQENIEDSN